MEEQILYTTRDVVLAPPLSHLQRIVRPTRLVKDWDEMQRTGASILHGTGSAALIMGKLASYPRQNSLAGAFGDMGKLERTPCILNLLCDETMRRQQRGRLNWHEGHNSLAKALFIGQQGEFRDRSFQDQFHRASCLMLLTAAIAAWNTVYLQKAIDALQASGVEISADLLRHVAPFGWEHINLLGRYDFDPNQARTLDNLRDLRLRTLLLHIDGEHNQE